MKYSALIFSLLLTSLCFGQVNLFSKKYVNGGELRPYDFELNHLNGSIIVGVEGIPNKSFCVFTDESGVPVWSKQFNPIQGFIELKNVIRLHDSTYLLVGTMSNPLTGKIGAGCIRLDQFGDTIWTKTIDNVNLEMIPQDVIQLKDSNILVTGSIHGITSFAFKLDLNGNKIWGKNYLFDGAQINWTHEIIAVKEHENGQLIFAGRLINQDGASWDRRGFVLKTDSTGEIIWSKNLKRGSDYVYLDDVVIQDSFYYFLNSASSDLIKTDSSLNVIWSVKAAWPNQVYDEKRSISLLHDSTMLITWYNLSAGYLQKIDQNGNVIDAATMVGYPKRIIEDNDYSILILNSGSLQNHFGVYKIDSLLNSSVCVTQNATWSQINSINVYPNSLTWQDPLGIFATQLGITDIVFTEVESCAEILGVNTEQTLAELSVFPSPFSEYIMVKLKDSDDKEYKISDPTGKVLLTGRISDQEEKISTEELTEGYYFLQVGNRIEKIVKSY